MIFSHIKSKRYLIITLHLYRDGFANNTDTCIYTYVIGQKLSKGNEIHSVFIAN